VISFFYVFSIQVDMVVLVQDLVVQDVVVLVLVIPDGMTEEVVFLVEMDQGDSEEVQEVSAHQVQWDLHPHH
jgi:hypothetical protein